MSIFDSWAEFIAQVLNSESLLAGKLVQHSGELGNARETLVRNVLARILPSDYEIGSGEIVDCSGNHSKQIDIVIARRDFPALSLPSQSKVYLLESVLATIEVKSTLNKKSLKEGLENGASVADLNPNIVAGLVGKIAEERGLKEVKKGAFEHEDPMVTARFDLIYRPPSYIFGFQGYKNSDEDFAEAIGEWANETGKTRNLALRHYPAVVAAEGCVGWRNDAPYSVDNKSCLMVTKDDVPLRLMILHILYTLIRKIPPKPDHLGIVPNLDVYIQQMKPPNPDHISYLIGETFNRSK